MRAALSRFLKNNARIIYSTSDMAIIVISLIFGLKKPQYHFLTHFCYRQVPIVLFSKDMIYDAFYDCSRTDLVYL